MPLRIRGKLLIAFSSVILPVIAAGGILVFYSGASIHKSAHKIQSIAEERAVITNLILSIERALMPGNDYIITGDKKYIDDFYKVSGEVEKRMKEAGGIAHEAEERKILSDAVAAWQNIKEISQRIFEIRNPSGNKEAVRLMEEMDYKWAYLVIERLKVWRELHTEEFQKAAVVADRVWLYSRIILSGSAFALMTAGLFLSFFYAGRFSRPIEKIHNVADAIAGRDFKARLDIKTGDEIEQLANAVNEMAVQLESSYSNLEQKVEERTRELKESGELLRLEINRMPFGHIVWDTGFRVMLWNPAAEQIFGFTSVEAEGKHPYNFIVPKEAQPQVDIIWQRLLEGDATARSINENITKDGRTIVCEWDNTTLRQPDGVIIGVLSMVQDITERNESEQALKKNEALLNEMGRLAKVGGWEFNAETRDMMWTEEVYCIHELDTTYKPTVDKGIEFYAPASRPIITRVVQRAIEYGEPYDVELEFITAKGNHRWVHANGKAHQEHGKTITVFGTFQDITERKQAEEKIMEQLDFLQRFEKVAIGREFRIKELRDENDRLKARTEELEGKIKKAQGLSV